MKTAKTIFGNFKAWAISSNFHRSYDYNLNVIFNLVGYFLSFYYVHRIIVKMVCSLQTCIFNLSYNAI